MPKIADILTKAIQATKAAKLKWEPVGIDSFRSNVGNIFIAISKDKDDDVVFSIYDDEGNLLELSYKTYFGGSSGFAYGEQELYELARRDALNVDSTLEELDQKLKGLI